MKVVCLWSGGKDSCFACYKAVKQGYNVISLLNFTNPGGKKSLSHSLSVEIIQRQVALIEIPLYQKVMFGKTYREEFIRLINKWKKDRGVEGIVFGDIYLQEHKDWIDEVCGELKVKEIMPLWEKNTNGLAKGFIKEGFKAIIVAVKKEFRDLLGKEINEELINELGERKIDFCGEQAEFHTFVYDGPIFKRPAEFILCGISENKNLFLRIN